MLTFLPGMIALWFGLNLLVVLWASVVSTRLTSATE